MILRTRYSSNSQFILYIYCGKHRFGKEKKVNFGYNVVVFVQLPVGVIGQKVTEFEKRVDFDGAKRTTAISEIKEVCLFPVQNMRAGWNKCSCIFKYRSLQNSDTPVFDFFQFSKNNLLYTSFDAAFRSMAIRQSRA